MPILVVTKLISNSKLQFVLRPVDVRFAMRRTTLTKKEIAARLGVSVSTVDIWRTHGILRARRYDDRNARLYEDPGPNPPVKAQGRRLRLRNRAKSFSEAGPKETIPLTKLRPLDRAVEGEKLLPEDKDLRRQRQSGIQKGAKQ